MEAPRINLIVGEPKTLYLTSGLNRAGIAGGSNF